MNDELDSHLTTVITSLEWGSVVPFLGAGANLCNRLENDKFDPPRNLPSSVELAAYLAQKFKHPSSNVEDLIRLTERIELDVGQALLYERLRELFNADFPTTPLHELLSSMPRLLREKGWAPLQLIVTTNYDDLLERAFRAAGEEVDVITYMAAGKESRGQFIHFSPDAAPQLIREGAANEYLLEQDDRGRLVRPAILKLHGAVDRIEADRDSFVITEDDYIDYVARSDVQKLIPKTLIALLKRSNLLFLGYSLRDWNVRAILRQVWALRVTEGKAWAIQRDPDDMETRMWRQRRVDILAEPLDLYVAALGSRLNQAGAPIATPGA
jgi:hypothetical protein